MSAPPVPILRSEPVVMFVMAKLVVVAFERLEFPVTVSLVAKRFPAVKAVDEAYGKIEF